MTVVARFTIAQLAWERRLTADQKIDIWKCCRPQGKSTKRLEMLDDEAGSLQQALHAGDLKSTALKDFLLKHSVK